MPRAWAQAAVQQTHNFDIPAKPVRQALNDISRITGVSVVFSETAAASVSGNPVSGTMTREQALSQLLAGTSLSYAFTNANTVTITGRVAQAFDAPHDGSVVLDTIDVTGRQGRNPHDAPYETAAATAYISGEQIERFRGTTPADMFTGTPGVLSGESRNGNSIDVNIRGMQGMGRVPVTVDGTLSSATVYQGYQGVSNRTYIDPDLIGGVSIQKGPGSGAYGGIGGSVSMETLNASDILLDGKNYGVRLKGGFGTNTSDIPPLNTVAGIFFQGARPGSVVGPADISRPSFLDHTREFGSIAGAMRGETFELVAAYAARRSGNYHAGSNGPSAASSEDLGPRSICRDYGGGFLSCTNYASYYENTGVSVYRGGEAVMNTSSDTDSWLLKGKFELPADQSLELIHTGFRSDHGDIRASILSSTMGAQATQRWTSTSSVDRYSVRHRWNPADNDLVDLHSNLWLTSLDIRNPTTASSRTVTDLGFPNPLTTRLLVGTDTRQWGADISNRSRFASAWGDVSMNYGISYLNEDTGPTDLTRTLEEFLPPNGARHEWQGFMNADWKPLDWLTFDGGLRYHNFSARDRMEKGDTPAAGFLGQPRGRSGSGVSPSIGVAVAPLDGVQLFARYSEGMRMPSMAESSAMAATYLTSDVRPERAHNWDIGVNVMAQDLLLDQDDVKFKLGWFHNTVDDYIARRIVNISTDFGTNYDGPGVGNIDRALFEGVELSGRYSVGGLSLELGASYYTDMAFCPTSGACQRSTLYGDYATNHVPPKYTASLTVSHKFLDDALTIGARATHVGPRAIKADQPTMQGASPFIVPINWKPYALVDVFASYEFTENLKADFRIDNVGDIHYVDPLGLANIPGPGRTVWASVTAKF
ncbi:TonB-dependent receptor [Aquamicrobium ahrensii]|uniref:Hemoglobin/transferrin/lactoferrin receptor protein n=1 Tax=Aquamicrobium ahrensii TaxID=469551 RepID=A0ABV2KGW4_9HYPH